MGFLNNYLRSEEFKRTSRNTKDDAVKMIFNWGAWAIIGFINFLRDMVKMAFGARR